MIAKFTRDGVKPGEEAAFAAEHGYELVPFDLATQLARPAAYKTIAVCRGGVRLMQRQDAEMDFDCSMPPWVLVSAVNAWGMIPAEADEPYRVDPMAVVMFLAVATVVLGALGWLGGKMGFWGWPW